MSWRENRSERRGTWGQRLRGMGAMVALVCGVAGLCAGCGDELQKEFREAAVGSIETGINSIADGIISGVFAVAEVNGSSSDASTDSTASADSGGEDAATGS